MLYFLLDNELNVKKVATERNGDRDLVCRADYARMAAALQPLTAWEIVSRIAESATKLTGKRYIPIDQGMWCSPRFDVIRLIEIGDPVSYTFNGDSYPDGHVVAISASLKVITTSSGRKYYRRRATGSWIKDGTWSLISGHHDERNPCF